MEISRKDLYSPSTISADLSSVASEISETVKSSGVAEVASTFETFDPSKLGITAIASTPPAISNVADYMDPAAALNKQVQSSLQSDNAQSLLKIIQDPKFREESHIQSLKDEAGNRFEQAMDKAETELVLAASQQSDLGNNVDPSEVPFAEIFQNIDERSERLLVPDGDFILMTDEPVDTVPSKVKSERKKVGDTIEEFLAILRAMNPQI